MCIANFFSTEAEIEGWKEFIVVSHYNFNSECSWCNSIGLVYVTYEFFNSSHCSIFALIFLYCSQYHTSTLIIGATAKYWIRIETINCMSKSKLNQYFIRYSWQYYTISPCLLLWSPLQEENCIKSNSRANDLELLQEQF